MSGILEGGWGFVYAAYGIVWVTLGIYAFSLTRKYFSKTEAAPNLDHTGDEG
jgi:hypothetical protein